ncbi:MAG: carbohydrate ABC transporter permease [Clostridia bacterium]|nr:carbohydrate ABC transporter permease [Clostridia bacterium]
MKGSVFFRKRVVRAILYIGLTALALYTLMPLLFLLLNSFKGQAEIIRNPLAPPQNFTLEYLIRAYQEIHFPKALGYTVLITLFSLAFIVLFSSLCGWAITRHKSRASTVIYLVFVAAMLIPFQAVMYPLMNLMDRVGLKNIPGLIVMYTGFGLSLSIFLYSGFFKSVPRAIEEAGFIDGANIFQTFFLLVFPLVKSTTVTVLILNGMWIWNDYLLPYLTLGTSESRTLVLELFYAKMTAGQFGNPWELIFPAVLISVLPMVIVFLCLQKYFVKGVSEGAIKS